MLGTPLGSDAFVRQHVHERIADEQRLWDAIPEVPGLQCAWQLLLQCAGPRANHFLRTLPPSQSAEYARAHDQGMWTACQALLGGLPGDEASVEMARLIASLPMRFGGLGLRSALRTAPAAYWASVADALGVLNRRLPTVAASAVERRSADHPPTRDASAIDEARWAGELLSREGFLQRPDWEQLRQGARPRQPLTREPGE